MLEIMESEKNKHYMWLLKFVQSLSPATGLKVHVSNSILSHTVQFVPQYGPGGTSDLPKLRYELSNGRSVEVPWSMTETWKRSMIRKKSIFTLSQLIVNIVDVDMKAFFELHWNLPRSSMEPYQPHMHIRARGFKYSLRKMHLPLNCNWDTYIPTNLEEYRRWLEGLKIFILREIRRCF